MMRWLWVVSWMGAAACAGAVDTTPTPLFAQPWDAQNMCWGATTELEQGGVPGQGCDDILTLASGPSPASCWLFSDSCVPQHDDWSLGCEDANARVDAPQCE